MGTSCGYLHINKEVNKETEEHELKEIQTELNPVEGKWERERF